MPGVMGSPGNIIRDGADGSSSASYAEGHWFESSSRTQRVMVTLSKNCQGRAVGALSTVKTPMEVPPARGTTQAVCLIRQQKRPGVKSPDGTKQSTQAGAVQGRKDRNPLRTGGKLPDLSCRQVDGV